MNQVKRVRAGTRNPVFALLVCFQLGCLATLVTCAKYESILSKMPDARKMARDFQDLYKYEYWLSPSMLKGSLLTGPSPQLKRVVLKLLEGQHVKIGTVGGSITAGASASKPGTTDWFSLFIAWLQSAFPEATISARNGAVGSTTSSFLDLCMPNHVDPDVDLVVVEYSVNDGYVHSHLEHEQMYAYERVVRKLAQGHISATQRRGQDPPALMLLHNWRCCRGDHVVISNNKTTVTPTLSHFYRNAEDHYNVLAQYYGLPSLSLRNALFHAAASSQQGFMVDEVLPSQHGIRIHPNDRGMKYIADVVVHAVQQALLSLALEGFSEEEARHAGSWALPAPMMPGNAEERNLQCVLYEGLKPLYKQSKGWEFGCDVPHKCGYISMSSGSTMQIQIDTSVPGDLLPKDDHNDGEPQLVAVHIGVLKSYEHMGMLRVGCEGGCSCKPLTVDCNDPADHSSQVHYVRLMVTQHAACVVGLHNEAASSSGSHKLKLACVATTVAALPDHG
eukprot:CAMPEP_0202908854 /NCGR_PEP_ID=MMETSP1392-20130828/47410_1 /ASSEMBLY_ACC=CAM_ASM_000868 /TAXON_ID=225041 /ORGANISM="Chlamydomonas chlamydogama, Strain SAG 11-48b" /LENGTH=503 /DNA_ID=CAMNT_0049598371 /DNA_START=225 /DNA_END=1732 /DNA_ORIENTATION=-